MSKKYTTMWNRHLGRITGAKHSVHLDPLDAPPIHDTSYHSGTRQWQLEKIEAEQVIEFGADELSITKWASSIVFVHRKDESLRFYIDYRHLNALPVRDSYLIQRMDEYRNCFRKKSNFSTLDASSGYWRIVMDEKGVRKTAFVTHHGLYRY